MPAAAERRGGGGRAQTLLTALSDYFKVCYPGRSLFPVGPGGAGVGLRGPRRSRTSGFRDARRARGAGETRGGPRRLPPPRRGPPPPLFAPQNLCPRTLLPFSTDPYSTPPLPPCSDVPMLVCAYVLGNPFEVRFLVGTREPRTQGLTAPVGDRLFRDSHVTLLCSFPRSPIPLMIRTLCS